MGYREIPRPPQPAADDSVGAYGLQLLAYVVRERTAILLSDDQCELALHVAPIASAVHVSGSKDDRQVDYRTAAADAVADAKREILSCQRIRQQLQAEAAAAAQPAASASQPAGLDAGPAGGSRVPRQPQPQPQPPAGSYAGDVPVRIF